MIMETIPYFINPLSQPYTSIVEPLRDGMGIAMSHSMIKDVTQTELAEITQRELQAVEQNIINTTPLTKPHSCRERTICFLLHNALATPNEKDADISPPIHLPFLYLHERLRYPTLN